LLNLDRLDGRFDCLTDLDKIKDRDAQKPC
jgi:hypothetical protein